MASNNSSNGDDSASTGKKSPSRIAMLIEELQEERIGSLKKEEESVEAGAEVPKNSLFDLTPSDTVLAPGKEEKEEILLLTDNSQVSAPEEVPMATPEDLTHEDEAKGQEGPVASGEVSPKEDVAEKALEAKEEFPVLVLPSTEAESPIEASSQESEMVSEGQQPTGEQTETSTSAEPQNETFLEASTSSGAGLNLSEEASTNNAEAEASEETTSIGADEELGMRAESQTPSSEGPSGEKSEKSQEVVASKETASEESGLEQAQPPLLLMNEKEKADKETAIRPTESKEVFFAMPKEGIASGLEIPFESISSGYPTDSEFLDKNEEGDISEEEDVENEEKVEDNEETETVAKTTTPDFSWDVEKYFGGEAEPGLQIGKEEVNNLFTTATHEICTDMQKAVSENDPEETFEIDESWRTAPKLSEPSKDAISSQSETYGGEDSVFAKYDTAAAQARVLAKEAGQAPVLPNEGSVSESIKETPVQETEENPLEQSKEESSSIALEKMPSVSGTTTSSVEPIVMEAEPGSASGQEVSKPVQESSIETQAETEGEEAATAQEANEPEFTLGTATVDLGGTPIEVVTYRDNSGLWTRANEIIAHSQYADRKDQRKSAGMLAGFKNIRRIRPQSTDGSEQKPEVFVNETGLRKMLAKVERQASKVKKVEPVAIPEENLQPVEPAEDVTAGETIPDEEVIPQKHSVEVDSKGVPVITIKKPTGPNGGLATINVDGHEVDLPTIKEDGVVWYFVGNLLDTIGYRRSGRSKVIRRSVGEENARTIRRTLDGVSVSCVHVNKEGLKQLIKKKLRPITGQMLPTQNIPQELQVATQTAVEENAPRFENAAPEQPPITPVHGEYVRNQRIIIDEHQLYVRGYVDSTSWYAIPDMLEFVGIVDPAEQQAFIERTVDPKEIRNIVQDYDGEKVLEPHVSKEGLMQLIPALNKVVREAKESQFQSSHVGFPSGAESYGQSAWSPTSATEVSASVPKEVLTFGRERMNINQKVFSIRTISSGNKVWYETNSIFQAAGIFGAQGRADLLARLVEPEHKYQPISGSSGRIYVDSTGVSEIFRALGVFYLSSPSQIQQAGIQEGLPIGEEQNPNANVLHGTRLGETELNVLGHMAKVRTATQNGSVWFCSIDIMSAFNQAQKEAGGRYFADKSLTTYVANYVSPQNIRQIQQKVIGKNETRFMSHINMAGFSQLEEALRITRAGEKPQRIEIEQEPVYPSAQDEANTIAARLHMEQDKMESSQPERFEPEPVMPTAESSPAMQSMFSTPMPAQPSMTPQPGISSSQVQQPGGIPSQNIPSSPMQPQMSAQSGVQQGFNAPQMPGQQPMQSGFVQQQGPGQQPMFPQQPINPMTGQQMQPFPGQMPNQQMAMGSQMPFQQMPQWPQSPAQAQPWPNPMAPQPMQDMPQQPINRMPRQESHAPRQIFVQDPSLGPNAPLTPAEVIQIGGREAIVRKKIEGDGPWYYYQDLFDAMGITPGSPAMAMFSNVVRSGAFRVYTELTPYGYRQAYYVNGIGMIEIVNEFERMVHSMQQAAQQMPMRGSPTMPQYQQPASMTPFGMRPPQTAQPGMPIQPQQQPLSLQPNVPGQPPSGGQWGSQQPSNWQATPQAVAPVSEEAKDVQQDEPVKLRETFRKKLPSSDNVPHDAEWLKNEERIHGIFALQFKTRRIRFVKDSARRIYVNITDIKDLVGRTKVDVRATYFEPNDFVKIWTPTDTSGRTMVYIGQNNLAILVERSKKPQAKKLYTWFANEAVPVILANAPTTEGL